MPQKKIFTNNFSLSYRPFHKTLPRSSTFVNWSSVRFYETDCTLTSFYTKNQLSFYRESSMADGMEKRIFFIVSNVCFYEIV